MRALDSAGLSENTVFESWIQPNNNATTTTYFAPPLLPPVDNTDCNTKEPLLVFSMLWPRQLSCLGLVVKGPAVYRER